MRRNDGTMRRNDGMMRRNDGMMRRNDGMMRRNDRTMRRNDRTTRRDDGMMRRNGRMMRRNDRMGCPNRKGRGTGLRMLRRGAWHSAGTALPRSWQGGRGRPRSRRRGVPDGRRATYGWDGGNEAPHWGQKRAAASVL